MEPGSYIGTELEFFARARRWKRYWGSILDRYLGERVLEIGAGLGETAKTLVSDRHQRWVCVEPDPKMADHIAKRIRDFDLPAICEVRKGTIDAVSETDFTSILYIDVLEHIADDRTELLEAAERLQRGGRLVVLAPAHMWLYSPFDEAIGHLRRYTIAELGALTPRGLAMERLLYLDSMGLLVSLANKLFLRRTIPNSAQIAFWDRVMVPLSRFVDPALAHRVGRTVLAIWRKE